MRRKRNWELVEGGKNIIKIYYGRKKIFDKRKTTKNKTKTNKQTIYIKKQESCEAN